MKCKRWHLPCRSRNELSFDSVRWRVSGEMTGDSRIISRHSHNRDGNKQGLGRDDYVVLEESKDNCQQLITGQTRGRPTSGAPVICITMTHRQLGGDFHHDLTNWRGEEKDIIIRNPDRTEGARLDMEPMQVWNNAAGSQPLIFNAAVFIPKEQIFFFFSFFYFRVTKKSYCLVLTWRMSVC